MLIKTKKWRNKNFEKYFSSVVFAKQAFLSKDILTSKSEHHNFKDIAGFSLGMTMIELWFKKLYNS